MRTALVSAPWTSGLPGLVNALSHPSTGSPFPTLQAAHDYVAALPSRGQLYIPPAPAGAYAVDSTPAYTGLAVANNVTVFGDGQECSRMTLLGQDPDLDCLTVEGSKVTIEGIGITGQGVAGDGVGVRFVNGGDPQRHAWLRDCLIEHPASWAVYFTGDPGTDITILSGLERVRIQHLHSKGAAYIGPGCTTIRFSCVNMAVSPGTGYPIVRVEGAEQCIFNDDCSFESTTDEHYFEWLTGGQLLMGLTVENCYFETHHAAPTQQLIHAGGAGGALVGGYWGKNIMKRYPEGVGAQNGNKPLIMKVDGDGPHYGLTLEHNRIYENRNGSTPQDDITITGQHEVILIKNTIYSRANGVARALQCTGNTAGVLDWDHKRFMFPRLGANPGSNLQGSAFRDIIAAGTKQFTGAAWQTLATTGVEEEE